MCIRQCKRKKLNGLGWRLRHLVQNLGKLAFVMFEKKVIIATPFFYLILTFLVHDHLSQWKNWLTYVFYWSIECELHSICFSPNSKLKPSMELHLVFQKKHMIPLSKKNYTRGWSSHLFSWLHMPYHAEKALYFFKKWLVVPKFWKGQLLQLQLVRFVVCTFPSLHS